MLKHLQNICKNVLVFYFTCNHGLRSKLYQYFAILAVACISWTYLQTRHNCHDPLHIRQHYALHCTPSVRPLLAELSKMCLANEASQVVL